MSFVDDDMKKSANDYKNQINRKVLFLINKVFDNLWNQYPK